MPNLTTNFSFNKPLVNDAVDEDLWGDQLNSNWDSIDTLLNQFIPIGVMHSYAGTTSPNAKWLLCDGAAVSRTTYATLFALTSTSYGVGDGSTTFNLPDYRGRAGVGLDNLGGASANRITDANADSLNNTGVGSETDAGTNGTTGGHALTSDENGPHAHGENVPSTASGGSDVFPDPAVPADNSGTQASGQSTASSGSGTPHTHPGPTWTGTTGSNVQASIAEGRIIRAL